MICLFSARPWFKPSLCRALTVSLWTHWWPTLRAHLCERIIATLHDPGKKKQSVWPLMNASDFRGASVHLMKFNDSQFPTVFQSCVFPCWRPLPHLSSLLKTEFSILNDFLLSPPWKSKNFNSMCICKHQFIPNKKLWLVKFNMLVFVPEFLHC